MCSPSGGGVMRTRRWVLSISALGASFVIAACHSWHVEPLDPVHLFSLHHPGAVRLTRADGSRLVLRHPVLSADTLVVTYWVGTQDSDARIALADIRIIETHGFSGARTAALVGVAAAVVVAASVRPCSGCACD